MDLLANLRDAGPASLAIVGVVNVLIGAILAFVGAVQLRKFAADTYVANLVGLAVVREMAAVMTAIVMVGRTGKTYAARIATMYGNEEIDALQVVGDHVVLPALLALVATIPFLCLYGCLFGATCVLTGHLTRRRLDALVTGHWSLVNSRLGLRLTRS